MRILIANDDGIDTPGILALVQEFSRDHELYIAAPALQQSAMSHSVIYFRTDLTAEERTIPGTIKAWAINGTPADCVYLGINELMDKTPDLVISGINLGPNMATDALYSGTLGAASEALISEVPAIAVSLCSYTSNDYACAARACRTYMGVYLNDPNRLNYLLSINVPAIPEDEIKGARVTHFDGIIDYRRPMEKTVHSDGTISFHSINGPSSWKNGGYDPYGDVTAVKEGCVSLTPVGMDMVCHTAEKYLKGIVK